MRRCKIRLLKPFVYCEDNKGTGSKKPSAALLFSKKQMQREGRGAQTRHDTAEVLCISYYCPLTKKQRFLVPGGYDVFESNSNIEGHQSCRYSLSAV